MISFARSCFRSRLVCGAIPDGFLCGIKLSLFYRAECFLYAFLFPSDNFLIQDLLYLFWRFSVKSLVGDLSIHLVPHRVGRYLFLHLLAGDAICPFKHRILNGKLPRYAGVLILDETFPPVLPGEFQPVLQRVKI